MATVATGGGTATRPTQTVSEAGDDRSKEGVPMMASSSDEDVQRLPRTGRTPLPPSALDALARRASASWKLRTYLASSAVRLAGSIPKSSWMTSPYLRSISRIRKTFRRQYTRTASADKRDDTSNRTAIALDMVRQFRQSPSHRGHVINQNIASPCFHRTCEQRTSDQTLHGIGPGVMNTHDLDDAPFTPASHCRGRIGPKRRGSHYLPISLRP